MRVGVHHKGVPPKNGKCWTWLAGYTGAKQDTNVLKKSAIKEPTLLEQNRPEVKTLGKGFYVSILSQLLGGYQFGYQRKRTF
jgi:hypothetical protein